jgi:MoxR-like ATPase
MTSDDADLRQRVARAVDLIRKRLETRIVGLENVTELILTAVFAGGHCLLVGVPGLAKTSLVRFIAESLDLTFHRIQFTPDLMPSDITGADVIVEDAATGERGFQFMKGPVFTNILLADEINRTPPKTQAALLEAMEEGTISIGGQKFQLETPFCVLATQNPIELSGTYPLPAAQLDRFMFLVYVDYPDPEAESRIVRLTTAPHPEAASPPVTREELVAIRERLRTMPVAEDLIRYATALVRRSRPAEPDATPSVKKHVAWGVGPRGGHFLMMGAKVRAAMRGAAPTAADVRAMVLPVFRHRLVVNYQAQADNVDSLQMIDEIIRETPAPDGWRPEPPAASKRRLFGRGAARKRA